MRYPDLAELMADPSGVENLPHDLALGVLGEVGRLNALLLYRLLRYSAASSARQADSPAPKRTVLTVQDVAYILSRTPKYVRELAKNGRLKGEKNGNRWEFTSEAVDDYQKKLLDQRVSHSYNATHDRSTTEKSAATNGKDTKGTGRSGRCALEHNRKIRKRRTGDSGTPIPFGYDYLRNNDAQG